MLRFRAPGLDLQHTLACGQVFCWRPGPDGWWEGWIGDSPAQLRLEDGLLACRSPDRALDERTVRHYLGLEDDLPALIATFPDDPWMRLAVAHSRGMHLLRQPRWECLAGFICSALKQVPHIMQINLALRERFGTERHGARTFPGPEVIANATESDLRALKLGFRARHLLGTARAVAGGSTHLDVLAQWEDDDARRALCSLPGVGEKVANCVLLFAYTRWRAFPVDTWIARGIRELYFPRRRNVSLRELQAFAADYFGPHAGLAQQYLFHWLRSHGRGPLPRADGSAPPPRRRNPQPR